MRHLATLSLRLLAAALWARRAEGLGLQRAGKAPQQAAWPLEFSAAPAALIIADNASTADLPLLAGEPDATDGANATGNATEPSPLVTSIVTDDHNTTVVIGDRDSVNSSVLAAPANDTTENTSHAEVPFGKISVTTNETRGTIIQVHIATPNAILTTYLLMFVPTGVAWATMYHFRLQEAYLVVLLAVTFCVMTVNLDLVNQSLSAMMRAPMCLTAIQALTMSFATGIWTIFSGGLWQLGLRSALWPLMQWTLVAILFTGYQLMNHNVSYYCSLSQRVIFTNMGPSVLYVLEYTLFPSGMKPTISFVSKLSLAAMVFGAVLFAIQYPDFTGAGILASLGLLGSSVALRLAQRLCIGGGKSLPVSVLASFDGAFVFVPSLVISAHTQARYWEHWDQWFSHPSIALLLVLSWITFTGSHVCSLAMFKVASATSFVVFECMAKCFIVFLGIVFFGDRIFQDPFVFIGMSISLLGCLAYTFELQRGSRAAQAPAGAQEAEAGAANPRPG